VQYPCRQDELEDVEGEEQSEGYVAAVAQGARFHDEGDPGQRGEHDDNHDVVEHVEDGGAAHGHLACHRAYRVCDRNIERGVCGEVHSCRYLV